MVGGMWTSWFQQLQAGLQSTMTLRGLFHAAQSSYYHDNLYEYLNAVKAALYVPLIWHCRFSFPGTPDHRLHPITILSENLKHSHSLSLLYSLEDAGRGGAL